MTDSAIFTCAARKALRQNLSHLLPRDRDELAEFLEEESQALAESLAEVAAERVNDLGCRLLAEAHGYVPEEAGA